MAFTEGTLFPPCNQGPPVVSVFATGVSWFNMIQLVPSLIICTTSLGSSSVQEVPEPSMVCEETVLIVKVGVGMVVLDCLIRYSRPAQVVALGRVTVAAA